MNSGGLKISISSWMYNMSIYFNCILVLTNVSYSINSCGNAGYKLYVGSLRVHVAELVLMVQISERVVLQKCMGYLGKKFVWMFGGFG